MDSQEHERRLLGVMPAPAVMSMPESTTGDEHEVYGKVLACGMLHP